MTKIQRRKSVRNREVIKEYYRKAYLKMDADQRSRITYTAFRNRIQAELRWADKESRLNRASVNDIKRAAQKQLNSTTFTNEFERSRANMLAGLKEKYRDEYNQLRHLSRDDRGRFAKLEANISYDDTLRGYVLNGRYLIDISNSPEMVNIIDLWQN